MLVSVPVRRWEIEAARRKMALTPHELVEAHLKLEQDILDRLREEDKPPAI
jgi:hypothetical protein